MNNLATQKYDYEKSFMDYIGANNINLTQGDLLVYREICKLRQLNPLNKEVYITKISGKMQMITAYTKIISLALNHPAFGGKETKLAVRTINPITNKEDVYIECVVYNKNGGILGNSIVWMSEYAKPSQNNNGIWDTKAYSMLEKVAVVSGLRRSLGDTFNGIFIREEFNQEQETFTKPKIQVEDNRDLAKKIMELKDEEFYNEIKQEILAQNGIEAINAKTPRKILEDFLLALQEKEKQVYFVGDKGEE